MKKRIIFVEKELLFPDFWIFKRINDVYWNFIFNFLVLRIIKRIGKENLLIIADYPSKFELEKLGIEAKTFGDYIPYYEQEEKYIECKNLIEELKLDDERKGLNYKGIDLWYILKEEFCFWIINPIYRVNLAKRIIEKEKPQEIIINSRRSINGKSYISVALKEKIAIRGYSPQIIDGIISYIGRQTKKYSLFARFHKMPGVIRREFVPTGNLERIKRKKKNILVLGIDKLYYSRIEPVVKELLELKENNVIMLTNKTNMQDELRKEGLNYVSFGDFLNKNIRQDINKKNREIIRLWGELRNDGNFRRLFRYKGEDLWQIIEEDLSFYFHVKFKWIMYYIETTNRLFDKLNIDLVATIGDLMSVTRSVIVNANSKSIPTLLVQQGLQVDNSGRFFVPLTCEKMALWGNADKDYMKRFGVEEKRLIVTGSQLHDNLSIKKISENRKEEIRNKLKLDKGKKTILLASQAFEGIWGEKAVENMTELVVSQASNSRNEQVIIKLHPREEAINAVKIINKYKPKNAVMVKREFSVEELINVSDVMITINSTCIYDAILLNKPVITINLIKLPEAAGYVKSGACVGVYNKKDYEKALKMVLGRRFEKRLAKGRKRWVRDYCSKNDGRASKRIAKLIVDTIKKEKSRRNLRTK